MFRGHLSSRRESVAVFGVLLAKAEMWGARGNDQGDNPGVGFPLRLWSQIYTSLSPSFVSLSFLLPGKEAHRVPFLQYISLRALSTLEGSGEGCPPKLYKVDCGRNCKAAI